MWKPSTARTARIAIGFALIGLLTGCGSRTSDDIRTAGNYDELDVMPLSPEVGRGTPTELNGVRIRKDGSAQARITVGRCSVPTRLEVTESSTTVEIAAYQRDIEDGACPMIGEAMFVTPDLPDGLRGREYMDASSQRPEPIVELGAPIASPAGASLRRGGPSSTAVLPMIAKPPPGPR